MTLYTDDDVADGGKALHDAWMWMDERRDLHGKEAHEYLARAVLDAVLPGYLISLADEIEARRPCKCTSCSAIKNLIREKAGE